MTEHGQYARVNGLDMYCEVHGDGPPLVLLHGGFGMPIDWGGLLAGLAASHRVITPQQQGHLHTADRDTPLTFESMADDTAALIESLGAGPADVFGYSDGGTLALMLAVRHPRLVRRLAVIGTVAGTLDDTYEPETRDEFFAISPATFDVPMLKEPYDAVAPDPTRWPVLVEKLVDLWRVFPGVTMDQLRTIQSPTLIILGDSEGIRPEHAVEMWRAIPNARLAMFPGADHFLLMTDPGKVLGVLLPFLDAPE